MQAYSRRHYVNHDVNTIDMVYDFVEHLHGESAYNLTAELTENVPRPEATCERDGSAAADRASRPFCMALA